jgi:hypothetical protein
MPNRDLTARSAQAQSELSDEARDLGNSLYLRIVDENDDEALRQFQELADASERMERPVEVGPPATPAGRIGRFLAQAATFSMR